MAYQQLEELTSRKREKVALFLTAENMAGLLSIGLPAYLLTGHTSLWLRILILFAAAGLGVALTSEISGLAFYERVLWWARGRARRLMRQLLRPSEFTAVLVAPTERPLPVHGVIRRAPKQGPETAQGGRFIRAIPAVPFSSHHPALRVRSHTQKAIPPEAGDHHRNGNAVVGDVASG